LICVWNRIAPVMVPLALVSWIVDDKQAFQVVEKPSFSAVCKSLNKFYALPSRRSLVRGIEDAYENVGRNIRDMFNKIPGRVAITCDGWSSRILRGYFVITVHWIDDIWRLNCCVLDFVYFPPPHNQWTTSDLGLSVLKY
jgi:hypothetical protein